MTVLDMAKAHIQNVVQRIEELNRQQSLVQKEIEQLKIYVDNGIKDLQAFESNAKEGEQK
jgi:type II secretory pathway component PulJ